MRSFKSIIPFSISLALLFAGSGSPKTNSSSCTPNSFDIKTCTADEFKSQLEKCYKDNDVSGLENIFYRWNAAFQADTGSGIYEDIKSVYAVYKAFYKPFDLLKLGEWEWGNDLNSNCKYAVIQDQIIFSTLLSEDVEGFDWKKLTKDTIRNFRPALDLGKDEILYLNDNLEKGLNLFLGTKSTKVGEKNIMDPSLPKGESEKRYSFLRKFIPVLHGHWGGYWHIATHPQISTLVLNKI